MPGDKTPTDIVNIDENTQQTTTMNWKTTIAAIMCVFAVSFIGGCTEQMNLPEDNPPSVFQEQTNSVDRAKNSQYNLDWFKQGSNYIWDGWKIK